MLKPIDKDSSPNAIFAYFAGGKLVTNEVSGDHSEQTLTDYVQNNLSDWTEITILGLFAKPATSKPVEPVTKKPVTRKTTKRDKANP